MIALTFFFSSRRRHTRYACDWSSDVCSSDLRYFAGAYKCLARVISAAPSKIPTHQKEGQITLEALMNHARESYGKCVHVMRLHMTDAETLDFLTVNGVPKRLDKAAINGFLGDFVQAERRICA